MGEVEQALTQHYSDVRSRLQLRSPTSPVIIRIKESCKCPRCGYDPKRPEPSKLANIIALASVYENVTFLDITSMRRYARMVRARHIICYLAHKFTALSSTQIGKVLNKDHSSVLHGIWKIEQTRPTDRALDEALKKYETALGGEP